MNFLINFWSNKKLKVTTIISIMILSVVFISIIILITSQINPWFALRVIFGQPFNDLKRFNSLINTFAYLLLASLATMTAFRYRVYNLGVIGQMLIAATTCFVVSRLLQKIGITSKFITILMIFIAFCSGGLYSLIAGIFKTRFKINEMATTLLLNIIALTVYNNLYHWSEYNHGAISNNASLTIQFSTTIIFSISIFIALIIFGIATITLDQRVFGFRLELTNINAKVASYAHLKPKQNQLIIISISGALAGLAGYIYFVANDIKLVSTSVSLFMEFDNLLISLLAFNSRIGIFFLAIFISFVRSQTIFLQVTRLDFEVIQILFSIYVVIATIVTYLIIWKKEPNILSRWRIKETLKQQSLRRNIEDSPKIKERR